VDLVEIGSDGTSIGKGTLANRACHLYREAGRPVTCVRIESNRRRQQNTGSADTEIFIELESSPPPQPAPEAWSGYYRRYRRLPPAHVTALLSAATVRRIRLRGRWSISSGCRLFTGFPGSC
jgi:hypothetical protein